MSESPDLYAPDASDDTARVDFLLAWLARLTPSIRWTRETVDIMRAGAARLERPREFTDPPRWSER